MSVTIPIPDCYVEHLCWRCPDCGLGPKIYPLNEKGEPIMPEETKDTPASTPKQNDEQWLDERTSEHPVLVARVHEVLKGLPIQFRRSILKSALQLLNW